MSKKKTLITEQIANTKNRLLEALAIIEKLVPKQRNAVNPITIAANDKK